MICTYQIFTAEIDTDHDLYFIMRKSKISSNSKTWLFFMQFDDIVFTKIVFNITITIFYHISKLVWQNYFWTSLHAFLKFFSSLRNKCTSAEFKLLNENILKQIEFLWIFSYFFSHSSSFDFIFVEENTCDADSQHLTWEHSDVKNEILIKLNYNLLF